MCRQWSFILSGQPWNRHSETNLLTSSLDSLPTSLRKIETLSYLTTPASSSSFLLASNFSARTFCFSAFMRPSSLRMYALLAFFVLPLRFLKLTLNFPISKLNIVVSCISQCLLAYLVMRVWLRVVMRHYLTSLFKNTLIYSPDKRRNRIQYTFPSLHFVLLLLINMNCIYTDNTFQPIPPQPISKVSSQNFGQFGRR